MSSKLITHCGAVQLDRKALMKVEAPKPTKTWQPVKHYDLLMEIEAALNREKISIDKEQLAVQRNGAFFYAVLDLIDKKHATKEYTSSLGIRASNNKLMSIQIAVGARVFVCDNLAFHGDFIALKRKHTIGLDLAAEVNNAIKTFAKKFELFSQEIRDMRQRKISDDEAKAIIFDVFEQRVMPVRLFDDVAQQYFKPDYREFTPRTIWSLHNALTFAAKDLTEERKFMALKKIGEKFSALVH